MIYGVGSMVSRLMGFLLLPVFTAYLTPTDYGILSLLSFLGQLVQPLFGLGLGAGMGPCYFDGENEQRKATSVWVAFILLSISNAVLIFCACVFSRSLSLLVFQTDDYAMLVKLSLSAIAINNLANPFMYRLQFEKRAKPFVFLTLSSTLVTIALCVIMVIFLSKGVEGMVYGQLGGYAAGTLFFILYTQRWTSFYFQIQVAKELLRLSLPLIPSFAFLFIITHSNKYILQMFEGLDAVGIYSIGFNFGMAISVLIGAFQSAWYPYFMSFMGRQEEAKVLFGRIFTYYLFGIGGITLFIFVIARPVVHLMTQPAFYEAYKVVGMISSSQFFLGMFLLLLPGMYFVKEVKYVSVLQCATAVILIVTSFLLIPPLSYLGAALSQSLSLLCLVGLTALWNKQREKLYIHIQYEFKRILLFAVFFIVFSGLMFFPYDFIWWQQILIISAAGIVIILTIFNLLHDTEKKLILGMLEKTNA